jgi:hypothetical protein
MSHARDCACDSCDHGEADQRCLVRFAYGDNGTSPYCTRVQGHKGRHQSRDVKQPREKR